MTGEAISASAQRSPSAGDKVVLIGTVFTFFFAAILAAVLLGHWLSEWLIGLRGKTIPFLEVRIDLGSGALALAVVVTTAQDVLTVLGNVPGYFSQLKLFAVFQDSLKLFCSVLALIVVASVLGPKDDEPDRGSLNVVAQISLPGPEPVITFPVLFGENGAGVLKAVENTRPIRYESTWTEGVTPDDSPLQDIVTLLSSCADGPNSVRLQVVGFASSLEYGDAQAAEATSDAIAYSNNFNTLLANERSENVAARLRHFVGIAGLANQIVVSRFPDFASYEEMVSLRPVLDRFGSANSKSRDQLESWSRRADVRVMAAGNCDRIQILRKSKVLRSEGDGGVPADVRQITAATG
ncbi:MAG: hypothetical protein WDO72_13480 [Pseudomonadota bacterium]